MHSRMYIKVKEIHKEDPNSIGHINHHLELEHDVSGNELYANASSMMKSAFVNPSERGQIYQRHGNGSTATVPTVYIKIKTRDGDYGVALGARSRVTK